MTNFVIGAVVGFLICVWAIGTTPGMAFNSLWIKLQHVQEMSAAANQAYDAMRPRATEQRQFLPAPVPAPTQVDVNTYR